MAVEKIDPSERKVIWQAPWLSALGTFTITGIIPSIAASGIVAHISRRWEGLEKLSFKERFFEHLKNPATLGVAVIGGLLAAVDQYRRTIGENHANEQIAEERNVAMKVLADEGATMSRRASEREKQPTHAERLALEQTHEVGAGR